MSDEQDWHRRLEVLEAKEQIATVMAEYSLTEMFEQVAMRVGDRTAIAWREERVSYSQLLERSRRVATRAW